MMQPVAAIGCTLLAVWKSWVAKNLQSPIMRKDAFCTWLGAGLSVVAVLAGVFEELGLGLADPIAAVLVGIVRTGVHSNSKLEQIFFYCNFTTSLHTHIHIFYNFSKTMF